MLKIIINNNKRLKIQFIRYSSELDILTNIIEN